MHLSIFVVGTKLRELSSEGNTNANVHKPVEQNFYSAHGAPGHFPHKDARLHSVFMG